MKHIKDMQYKGHEVILSKDVNGLYIIDIREDNYDGELIDAWSHISSEKEAIQLAKKLIDNGWKERKK